MRRFIILPKAKAAITDVAEFIELINTPGSSEKWLRKVEEHFRFLITSPLKYFPLCNNEKLAKLNYSCSVFNRKWIIVFRYTATTITIHRFVLGSKLH
jgi:hypothetical protein